MRSIVRTSVSLVGVVGVLGVGLSAADGVLIVQRITSGTGAASTAQMQIDKTRMRAETTDANGGKQVMVFDGTKQTMYIIDMNKKSYSEMTKADMDRMGAQMQDAMAQMKAAMANVPPEARAQMEAMMKGRGTGAAAPAKPEYKKTGTDKVGKWTCDKYEGYRDGQKTSELCTVDPSALGFTAADFSVTQQFMTFFEGFKSMMPQAAGQAFGLGKASEQGFSGLPVKSSTISNGQTTTTEMTEASRQSFADSVFAVPEGFQKTEMGMGMGGRRGRQ